MELFYLWEDGSWRKACGHKLPLAILQQSIAVGKIHHLENAHRNIILKDLPACVDAKVPARKAQRLPVV